MKEKSIIINDLRELVFEIAEHDHQEVMQKPGIFDGAAGLALFYYEMYRYCDREEFLEQAVYCFGEAYRRLSGDSFGLSHGSSGVMWVLKYLAGENVLAVEAEDYLQSYDEILLGRIDELTGNLDPMHGLLSIANYLLFRGTATAATCLGRIVRALEESQLPMENGVSWVCTEDDRESGLIWHINFGYAHGVPAILYFIEKMMRAGICPERCRKLYTEGLSYLLSNWAPDGRSCFPNRIERAGLRRNYRMAYCNGDLGLACGLSVIARDMGDEELFRTAGMVAANAASMALTGIGQADDIGLCHGAAGNGYLFLRLYKLHGQTLFEEVSIAHYRRLLELRRPGTGIAGLTALDFDKENGRFFRRVNPGFIEGTAGVGLSILSYLNGGAENAWDKILYLS